MADTVVSDALRYPQDEGLASAIADGVETWASAGYLSGLAEAVGTEAYVHNGLTFSNHDGTNDQVDVASGRAYVFLSGAQVQSTLGGSSPPSYDAGLVDSVPIMIVLPSGVADLDVSSGTLNPIWLAYATDDALAGVGAADVYVRHGDGETAPPHPSVKLGETNPDDATADTRASDDPVINARSGTFDSVSAELSEIDGSVAQHGVDDAVVVISKGEGASPSGVFPLSSSSAPLSDAYDYMATENLDGTVLLPPTEITDSDLSSVSNFAERIDMIGRGTNQTTIKVPDGEEITISPSGGVSDCYWHGFLIGNDANTSGASGLRFTDVARQMNIGHLSVGWEGGPAINWDTGHPFGGVWNSLDIGLRDANSALRLNDSGAPHRINNIYASMSGGAEVMPFASFLSPNLKIGTINVDGSPGELSNMRFAGGAGSVQIDEINFEPTTDTTLTRVVGLAEQGYVKIGNLQAHGGGGATLTVDQIVELGGGNGNNHIHNIESSSITINNNPIYAANEVADPSLPSYYYGPASDVTDFNGGAVRIMSDAGTSS